MMTNILSLKTIAYNRDLKAWVSPSHKEYHWVPGINLPVCSVVHDEIPTDCWCGIYSSPNPKTLDEYASYSNSIPVLLNNYSWVDIWTAPLDLNGMLVCRSGGARIIGVAWIDPNNEENLGFKDAQRWAAALQACEFFDVKAYPWKITKQLIQTTWIEWANVDPFDAKWIKQFNKEK